ncbi:MAG TPA: gliding motility-associated C-terminal domain-containing protein [Bacteroidia bacterium]|nr:gliding motility-associated C-terminal domain-containing protein [Bacteroidia bacterium]
MASYPYREDFESGTGSWTAGGTNTDWVMGTPSKAVINSAASGNNCWITGGLTTAFYNYGERSWVMSPCFDFSGLVKPMVTVSVFWDTEYLYDGANLQYSTDGFTWKTIGSVSEPDNCVNQNWYNVNSVTNLSGLTNNNQGWAGTVQSTSGSCRGGHGSGGWMEAKHCLSELAGQSQVIFRFIFGSGTTCNDYDGFAFDLFKIEETPAVPFTIARNCIASNVVEFDDAGAACHTFWNWNFGDPASASNTSNLQSPQHTFTAPGKYTVTLYSGNECTPEVSATTDVYILFVSTSSTPETCVNAKDGTASVHVSGSPAISQYTWNTDPIQTTATAVGLSAGQYAVNITAANSCAADAHIDVLIGPDAFPRPDLGPDSTLCPGSFIFLDAGNYQSFLWQDSSALQSYVVEKAGLYTVRITNSAGCTGSDTIQISEDCLNDIVFPNAFTPNGDQVNDLFLPVGSEISNYNLSIYNRWGQLMYETNDQNAGWDGTLSGRRQEAAVYLFKAGYSVRSGDVKEKTGKLILIR